MQLVARGICLMMSHAIVYAPRSLAVRSLRGCRKINAFMNLQEMIETMETCRTSRLDKFTDFTRPSFRTPIKKNQVGT
jgi:hypothetical protein